jgi:hypothetical protein
MTRERCAALATAALAAAAAAAAAAGTVHMQQSIHSCGWDDEGEVQLQQQ